MNSNDQEMEDRLSLELDDDSRQLNLKQLYYFHVVATEGTIAGAAKRLRLSQGTISEQVKNLEQYLEHSLFERRPTGVRLNSYGRRVYKHTQVMFHAVHHMLQEINPRRAHVRWVLEIGVCPTISRTFVAERFLPLFQPKDLMPRIRQGRYEALLEELLRGGVDLLLSENRPAQVDEQRIGVKQLTQTPLILVAAPDVARRVENFPDDLAEIPFISYTSVSHYRWAVDRFFHETGIAPEVLGEVDDVVLMSLLAIKGLCFAAVPEIAAHEYLERNDLVSLGELPEVRACVYAHFQSTRMPEVVRRAIKALTGEEMESTVTEER